jgi:hypothetical protein
MVLVTSVGIIGLKHGQRICATDPVAGMALLAVWNGSGVLAGESGVHGSLLVVFVALEDLHRCVCSQRLDALYLKTGTSFGCE